MNGEEESVGSIMKSKEMSVRTQNILEHLEKTWELPQELSPENLRYITELVMRLQEPYRATGLKVVAGHIINDMSLHILNILSTFQRKSETEGISLEERDETFDATVSEIFQILNELTKHVSVQSLDEVAILSNITISLQTASETTLAIEAQSLLYELPTMYYSQLVQEHLIVKESFHWTMKIDMPTEKIVLPLSIDVNKMHFSSSAA